MRIELPWEWAETHKGQIVQYYEIVVFCHIERGRPAPHCSNPDSSRFDDPGDGAVVEDLELVSSEPKMSKPVETRCLEELDGSEEFFQAALDKAYDDAAGQEPPERE